MKPSSDELDLTAVVKRLPGEFLEARWASAASVASAISRATSTMSRFAL